MALLISLEGIDAAGKTTQLQMLMQHLQDAGRDFVCTREPGGTPVGEQLREVLLRSGQKLTVHSEAFLFAAARAELVSEVIRPALAKGIAVICDRYTDSSIAYQAYGRGLPVEFVQSINEMGTGDLRPHRTFLFDLPVSAAMQRFSHHDKDRMESMDLDFYERVREGYLEMAAAEPERIKIIAAGASAEEVHRLVVNMVEEIWPK